MCEVHPGVYIVGLGSIRVRLAKPGSMVRRYVNSSDLMISLWCDLVLCTDTCSVYQLHTNICQICSQYILS